MATKAKVTSGPPQVLCVGMLRTGTASLSVALSQLGYSNVYHGLNHLDNLPHWRFLERAAIATWPEQNAPDPSDPPPSFTRKDWDEFFDQFDALTDLACFWAPELIAAYPDAKVILTERDYEPWFKSFNPRLILGLFGPGRNWYLHGIGTILGNRAGYAMQKTLKGYFGGADTVEELQRRAPSVFRKHAERIKRIVPPERLLVYKVGRDGWEPLCIFLGKDVPNGDFPFVNEAEAHSQLMRQTFREHMVSAAKVLAPYAAGLVAIALWWWRR